MSAEQDISPMVRFFFPEPSIGGSEVPLPGFLKIETVTEEIPGELYLQWRGGCLTLYLAGDISLKHGIAVNFGDGKSSYRQKQIHQELLVRACRVKRLPKTRVFDATGGLGRDAFILAAAGHRVIACERNPVIAALLEDGLTRGYNTVDTKNICQNISLVHEDAAQVLQQNVINTDIIYLDPMFPESGKSAKVKKDLQLLQLITGKHDHGHALLKAALTCDCRKIVVKRPAKGEFLSGIKPDYSLKGKAVRFDIYQGKTKNPAHQ